MIFTEGNTTDPNKILPMRYPWAWKLYKDGVANNWTPEEISMQRDIEQWKSTKILTDDERRMILWNLGFFSTAESLTANNLVLAVYRHLPVPEFRQYLLRQAFEEAIHTHMFIYCCDSLGLDYDQVYGAYNNIQSIKAKDEFVVYLTKDLTDPNFKVDTNNIESVQKFLRNLIGFYLIMEGIFFYAGFAMMLGLKNQRKMVGVGEQFEYTLRDETVHIEFGVKLINQVIKENPLAWTSEFQKEIYNLVEEAFKYEKAYVEDALPNGIFGMAANQFEDYIQYICNRRLKSIGLHMLWPRVKNPFDFMSKTTDIRKEKNFFETRVTEYQSASKLKWD